MKKNVLRETVAIPKGHRIIKAVVSEIIALLPFLVASVPNQICVL